MRANTQSSIWKMAAYILASLTMATWLACGVVGGGPSAPGNPEDMILDNADSVLVHDVKSYLEASELPGEEDAVDAQDEWRDEWQGDVGLSFNTDPDQVTHVISVLSANDRYRIIKGDFDFDEIQNELEDQDFEEDTYRDFPIWEDGYGQNVALFEDVGTYVSGDEDTVKDILKAIDRGEGFMQREADLRRALDSVGDGFYIYASTDCDDYMGELGSFAGYLSGCDSAAVASAGGGEDETLATVAIVFSNERRAESGMEDLEDSIEDSDYIDADVEENRLNGDVGIMKLTIYEQ